MQNPAVYAEVSSRIYPKKLPIKPTIPSITILEPNTSIEDTTDAFTRIQFTVYGAEANGVSAFDATDSLLDKLTKALLNHTGNRNGVYVTEMHHVINTQGLSDDELIDFAHSEWDVTWEKI
jgi:hypothetical protein